MTDTNLLRRIRSLRKASKELSVDELENLVLQIQRFIADRKVEEKQLKAEQAEKLKQVKQIQQAMADAGINISDLDGTDNKPRSTKRNRQPFKYEILDKNGKLKMWSGSGRKPNLIIKYLKKKGNMLEDLLIK
ncbi:MAG: H-NS histone family protein [Pseudomonadales bacterium]|nr:H-NS histone family protein [Pseudomonadales bacterium]